MRKNSSKNVKCKIHPKYRGKREPRILCRACWRYFVDEQIHLVHLEYRRFEEIILKQRGIK